MMVKTNMKASEIIDCTCTVASISKYNPFVLLHVASLWHLPTNASHLSVSVVKLKREKEKKYMNKISTKA